MQNKFNGGVRVVRDGRYQLPTDTHNGFLEASYLSSMTMLVLCVMPTAAMQLNAHIKHTLFKRFVVIAVTVFTVFMVIGRLLSGVHWLTDIIGGSLLSAAFVITYDAIGRCK